MTQNFVVHQAGIVVLPSWRRIRQLVVFGSVHSGQFHIEGYTQNAQPFKNREDRHTPNHCPADDDDGAQHIATKHLKIVVRVTKKIRIFWKTTFYDFGHLECRVTHVPPQIARHVGKRCLAEWGMGRLTIRPIHHKNGWGMHRQDRPLDHHKHSGQFV